MRPYYYSHIKKLFPLLTLLLMVSCASKFDDTAIQERLDNHETRIANLEKTCSQLNSNLVALSRSLDALQEKDFITSMTPIVENGTTIGHVLNFFKGGVVTIYHGKTLQFGVAQDSDGIMYWTLDGKWFLNGNGEKVRATGTVPQMKIENNSWLVSLDDGKTWIELGRAAGTEGDLMFKDVTQDELNVYLTLVNGTVITLPKERELSIIFDADDLVVMNPNDSRDIHYTITSSYDSLSLEWVSSDDLHVRHMPDEDPHSGVLHIETGESIDENTKVLVFVNDGYKYIMRAIHFEQQALTIENAAKYNVPAGECWVNLSFLSNVDCQIEIPESAKDWLSRSDTKVVTQRRIVLNIAKNNGQERETKVWISTPDGTIRIPYVIFQAADPQVLASELAQERAILVKWYNETSGSNWKKHNNWCSDKPMNEWEGVYTNYGGHVWWISLPNNNMNGKLPEEIWRLRHLEHLYIPGNNLEIKIPDDPDKLSSSFTDVVIGNFSNAAGRNRLIGGLPHSISKFENLLSFHAPCMEIGGTIPDEIWSLPELVSLHLGYNRLEGELSSAIGNAKKLQQLNLPSNRLSGAIPEAFGEMESLQEALLGNTTRLSGFDDLYLECNHFTSLPESMGKLSNLYTLWIDATGLEGPLPDGFYDCAILENVHLGTCRTTAGYKNQLGVLSERFGEMPYLYNVWINGAGLSGEIPRSFGKAQHMTQLLLASNDLTGNLPEDLADVKGLTSFNVSYNRLSGEIPDRILNCEQSVGWVIEPQQKGYGLTANLYKSKDYSRDGKVVVLQKATIGKGIDLVVMGDAFADKDLADGSYERTMRKVVDHFFAIEPYASFKDYFNVYMVEVVSENNRYAAGAKRALSTGFGEGTYIYGDDAKCFEYAQKAVGEERMDEVLVVVALNRKYYAGTCYMYHPDEGQGDYGNGPSIAYFPLGTDDDMFRGLVQHEAGGHGFTKLDDEYDYGATVGESFIKSRTQMFDWGWWANIDFTNDPNAVKWARFLDDSRYANEGLGVFEGGSTYGKGVWRPTENSIMRYNTGTYNAPSREAIYKRINKLAYGADWQYDYEQFVEADAVSRAETKATWNNWRRYDPTEKPVITGKSWRNASGAPVVEESTPRSPFSSNTKSVATTHAKDISATMEDGVLTMSTTVPIDTPYSTNTML